MNGKKICNYKTNKQKKNYNNGSKMRNGMEYGIDCVKI